eukprot:m.20929 g.20929  ORF g.20929 m.20929 type:complete len:450 (-) comp5301_c0_seq1:1941-3290(-)
MSNANRFKDRNPDVVAAGRKYPADKNGVKLSLFSNSTEQDQTVGVRVTRPNDPNINKFSTFGIKTTGSTESAAQLIRPQNRTKFQEQLEAFHPQQRAHGTTDFERTAMFGKANDMTGPTVGMCMKGSNDGNENGSDEPGMQTMRNYGNGFSKMASFGIPTPNDPSGSKIKESLKWNSAGTNGTRIVSTKAFDFLKGQERIDPMSTAPLGYCAPSDNLSAQKLMDTDRKAQDRIQAQTDMAKKIRPLMMMSQYFMFNSFDKLKEVFEDHDVDQSGTLDKAEFKNVLSTIGFDFEDSVVDGIMRACDQDGDGQINYGEFISIANFGEPLPSDVGLMGKKKKSSYVNESTTFGMASIRTDRPPPLHESVANKTNYGDPTTSGILLTPSPLTSMGLSQLELESPRSKQQLARIFKAMYPTLTDEDVEEVWNTTTNDGVYQGLSINDFSAALLS